MNVDLSQVTVVVLSYNRKDQLPKTVSHLLEIVRRTGCELMIVDNASSDGALDAVRPLLLDQPCVRLLANDKNMGVSEGRNIGWRAASRDFILSIDDDILLSEYDILEMLNIARQNDDAGIVSPDIVDSRTGRVLNGSLKEENGSASLFYEGCFFISRAALSDVGYLDPVLHIAGEGMDYSLRLRAAGYVIKRSHDTKVVHIDRVRSVEETSDRRKKWLWSFSYVYWKNLDTKTALVRSIKTFLAHTRSGVFLFGLRFVVSLPRVFYMGARAGSAAKRTRGIV